MFFHLQLEREIELQPRFFGPRLGEVLHQKLRTEVRCCGLLISLCSAYNERQVLLMDMPDVQLNWIVFRRCLARAEDADK